MIKDFGGGLSGEQWKGEGRGDTVQGFSSETSLPGFTLPRSHTSLACLPVYGVVVTTLCAS